ncbi:MAG: aspartate--tRNA ligase [Candidatus Anammoxibacter sp.]
MANLKRTHTCGEIGKDHVAEDVVIAGWVNSSRDHGGVTFIDLRDRYGITQAVFNPETGEEVHTLARSLRSEYVVAIRGKVALRSDETINPNMQTGKIEIIAEELQVLNRSETPPFEISESENLTSLEIRLKYRYLDLRRYQMQRNLIFRHKAYQVMRRYLDNNNFLEIETPFLTKSTPEGARDYLVPSRVNLGKCYALPQSPQLFKQLLMVSGYDRYFQIVRCFRDEDLRSQRQPEFTQLDLELSFIDEEDIYSIIETLMVKLFSELLNIKIQAPFTRIPYKETMDTYGCDKPDLRYGLKIKDITDIGAQSEFKVFKSAVKSGGKVKGINAKGCSKFSRKDIDELTASLVDCGAKGLAWFKVDEDGFNSSITKFFSKELQNEIAKQMDAEQGDLLLFVADTKDVVNASLAQLRINLAKIMGLTKKDDFKFVWIVDFPLFDFNNDMDRYDSLHHPFTSPRDEDLATFEEKPLEAKSRAYDIVLNGVELGGGSIRIHDPAVQKKVFKLLNIDDESAREKFGFLLDGLKYGAPPHGGIALGVDRMMALMLGLDDIREVIPFPKTQKATCLMTGAPSKVDKDQLKELGLEMKD